MPVSRVTEYLVQQGVPFEVMPHSRAFTSVAEAIALGVPMHDVVKTLMVNTPAGRAIVVIPGSARVDMHLVRKAVGDNHCHLTSEDDLQRDFPDFDLGCLPPIGSLLGVRSYVDPEVLANETIVFAECQTGSVKMRTGDLFGREQAVAAPLVEIDEPEEAKELIP